MFHTRASVMKDKQPGVPRPMTEKLESALAWLMTGNDYQASELCGVPRETIRDWRGLDSWEHLMDQAKKLKQNELDSQFTKIIHKSMEEITDRLEKGDEVIAKDGTRTRKAVSAKDMAWITATFADKRAVIRGQPTSISQRTNTEKALKEKKQQLEALGKESTQDSTETPEIKH